MGFYIYCPLVTSVASHGVRTVDNLRIYCGITDPDELEVRFSDNRGHPRVVQLFTHIKSEAQRFEEEIVNSASKDGKEGIVRLPGVTDIVNNVSVFLQKARFIHSYISITSRFFSPRRLQTDGPYALPRQMDMHLVH